MTGLLTGLVLGRHGNGTRDGRRWSWRLSVPFGAWARRCRQMWSLAVFLGVRCRLIPALGRKPRVVGLPIATLALIVKNIYNGMFVALLCHKADNLRWWGYPGH